MGNRMANEQKRGEGEEIKWTMVGFKKICPSISVNDNTVYDILNNQDEIIIRGKIIIFKCDFPLNNPITFSFTSDKEQGFTLKFLIQLIQGFYQNLYGQKEESIIPGHDIDELWIVKLTYYPEINEVKMGIEYGPKC